MVNLKTQFNFVRLLQKLKEVLEENKTLKVLNLDSNEFTAEKVCGLVQATLKNKTLLELRASNQVTGRDKVVTCFK